MSKKYCDSAVTVRRANRDDMLAVAGMVQELADFEKMPEGPKITAKDLQRDGFDSSPPAFRCLVAEVKKEKETAVAGYALYFPVYSTWEGRSMLLEDLYVRAGERRRGVGHRLFDAVAALSPKVAAEWISTYWSGTTHAHFTKAKALWT